ncbi:MAG: hypothetical protein M0Q49_03615 [Porticoccaceae bacterium]|nr:hypothetical protein [Porticoccaceae bacterium]
MAKLMQQLDAEIFDEIGEELLLGTTRVPGIFRDRYHEVELIEGGIVGFERSFACQITADIAALQPQAVITVVDHGRFRFVRRVPETGDETGHVILELGALL